MNDRATISFTRLSGGQDVRLAVHADRSDSLPDVRVDILHGDNWLQLVDDWADLISQHRRVLANVDGAAILLSAEALEDLERAIWVALVNEQYYPTEWYGHGA